MSSDSVQRQPSQITVKVSIFLGSILFFLSIHCFSLLFSKQSNKKQSFVSLQHSVFSVTNGQNLQFFEVSTLVFCSLLNEIFDSNIEILCWNFVEFIWFLAMTIHFYQCCVRKKHSTTFLAFKLHQKTRKQKTNLDHTKKCCISLVKIKSEFKQQRRARY